MTVTIDFHNLYSELWMFKKCHKFGVQNLKRKSKEERDVYSVLASNVVFAYSVSNETQAVQGSRDGAGSVR